jgi:ring-1,2-phenylacetyl-CoA epoxidase subunit PaaA
VPDPDLSWDGEHYRYGEIDWAEFREVMAGNGPCNRQRMAFRVAAHEDGAWVREAAEAYAARHAVQPAAEVA